METNPLTAKTKEIDSTILEEFRVGFAGSIFSSDDTEYESERQLWNKMIDKHPGLIAQCTGVHDVIQAVNFARKNKLLVAVRGGGHNVAGNAMNDGGLVIDLSHMRTVLVDPKNKTAVIQGGATWADVDRETQAFGLVCPGGVVSETGVGGLTLGGGLSWLRRKVGMSIDNIVGANMVLADGKYIHVSESENQDLFWAIKGGGGNFGIVTSFEFKLYDLGPEVMFVSCMYPRDVGEKVMKWWVQYTRQLPDEITSDCIHWSVPAHPAFPEEMHGTPVTVLAALYFGSAEEGQKVLQPFREVAQPFLDLSNIYPYGAVQQMFDPFLEKGVLNSYWKSLYVDDLSESLQKLILDRANQSPAPQSLISIRNLHGAIGKVPTEDTAFGDRSARFLVSIDTMWEDASQNDHNIQWTRDFFKELRQHSKGQVYFNFNSDMSGSDHLAKDSFGANYEKLVAIKTKFDPHNFFRLNANIRPKG
ncbi:MAG: FAD-binding oxidoreductase [Maribacter sp.]|nr:FAD-binding oxidoreductase [Maribacter sp.]